MQKVGKGETPVSPEQSHYVLEALIEQGRVRRSHVDQVLRSRQDEIRRLKERLKELESLGTSRGPARKPRPKRRTPSPKVRALRRLQGRYMGFVRPLKASQKARVRKVRESRGMQAAIRLAESLGKRRSPRRRRRSRRQRATSSAAVRSVRRTRPRGKAQSRRAKTKSKAKPTSRRGRTRAPQAAAPAPLAAANAAGSASV